MKKEEKWLVPIEGYIEKPELFKTKDGFFGRMKDSKFFFYRHNQLVTQRCIQKHRMIFVVRTRK